MALHRTLGTCEQLNSKMPTHQTSSDSPKKARLVVIEVKQAQTRVTHLDFLRLE